MATLLDVVHLLANDNTRVPLDWMHARTTLYNFLLFHGLISPDDLLWGITRADEAIQSL